jgi:hypothetical protein
MEWYVSAVSSTATSGTYAPTDHGCRSHSLFAWYSVNQNVCVILQNTIYVARNHFLLFSYVSSCGIGCRECESEQDGYNSGSASVLAC